MSALFTVGVRTVVVNLALVENSVPALLLKHRVHPRSVDWDVSFRLGLLEKCSPAWNSIAKADPETSFE